MRYGRVRYPSHLFSPPDQPVKDSPSSLTDLSVVSVCLNRSRLRNFCRMCIDYAFRPRLSSRLTQGGRTYPWKPETFDHYDSHAILATHSGILTSVQSTVASASTSPHTERSPTQYFYCLSFGYTLSPVKFSAQHHSTSELLRTLLMSGCF